MLYFCLLTYIKINFFQKFFQEYNQSVKQFGFRSGLMFCQAPDQSQNCLQRLSADDTSRQRINPSHTEYFYAVCDCGISGRKHFSAHLSRKRMGEPIKIYHECEGRIEKYVPRIAVWHHEACRGMTTVIPRDRFFYPTLTRIMDSFSCSPLFLFIY